MKNLKKNKAQNRSYMAINQHQANIGIKVFSLILSKPGQKKEGKTALFPNKQGYMYEHIERI